MLVRVVVDAKPWWIRNTVTDLESPPRFVDGTRPENLLENQAGTCMKNI